MYDSAFKAALYEQLSHVYRYLIKKGANPQDAEDIVQDTAYKYLMNLEAIEAAKVKSWLYRVAINQFYDILRRQKRTNHILKKIVYDEEAIDDLPEDILLEKEFQEHVQLILHQLREPYREILLLKYDLELKYTEIADMLNISIPSVKMTLHRARKQFLDQYRRMTNERKK
ncbi:RNA polymerase sigma factor [Bacillus chungangensis]|uniref:RNA polymerase sigma-70 factor (ECF subfamily) n=1 Tax=Bacillus chungangensis TaxID=587633 RepID=A0ABT9WU02_9BACI|nr:RNA polymerase sigma factor [Bacillus chungangensis]MDQ0176599.1 RNA polymerase sigma-70 factor (ECF subfamily) [Bacillus chungangensis]